MSQLEVRIVSLEPMRVAAAYGFGDSPELIAWEKILNFAKSKGILDQPQRPRFFGFNNPDPSPGSPNYGYEQWMTIGPDVAAQEDIQIKEIPGGLYAVTRCHGIDNIMETWQQLAAWGETSHYKLAHHQYLEEMISPIEYLDQPAKYILDLYLPISE